MIIAVLFSNKLVRLGWTKVPPDTYVIDFGGGRFCRHDDETCFTPDGAGIAFNQVQTIVLERLDVFDPGIVKAAVP